MGGRRTGNGPLPGGRAEQPDVIEADTIVVEITDKNSGRVFRRHLPVTYCETGNGIVLSGESLAGTPCQIVLLSDDALARMGGLFGKGPDVSPCGGTED